MADSQAAPSHWQVLIEQDSLLNDEVQTWRNHINNSNKLERKYKELLMVSMFCILRAKEGIMTHGKFAIEHGATKDELFAAITQSFLPGGIPAFREGALAFKEMFPDYRPEQ